MFNTIVTLLFIWFVIRCLKRYEKKHGKIKISKDASKYGSSAWLD